MTTDGNPATRSRMITAQDLYAALERSREETFVTAKEQYDVYKQFMAGVPVEFRDHPEITQMASIAAMSVISPLHPKDHERLAKRYEEIIHGG